MTTGRVGKKRASRPNFTNCSRLLIFLVFAREVPQTQFQIEKSQKMTKGDDESEKTGGIPVSNLMSQALRELRLPENESQVSNAPVSTPALSARTEQVNF